MQHDDVIALKLSGYPIIWSRPEDEVAAMIAYYAASLADIEPDVIAVAFDTIGGKYPPSMPEVRDECARITSGAFDAATPESVWASVNELASRVGAYRGYDNQKAIAGFTRFDGPPDVQRDPMIAAAVRAVGWNTICEAEDDATKSANRKRFIDAYTNEQRRTFNRARLSPEGRALLERVQLRIAPGNGSLKQLMQRGEK